MTLDYDNISVFNFRQIDEYTTQENNYDPKFRIKKTAPNDIELLNSLGVNNSSVFLANCTIWVEGITDVLYLRAYIDKYLKENKEENNYQEDIHYAFVTYAGSCISNWDFTDNQESDKIFADAISNNIFLIADNDNNKKTKRDKKLTEELEERYYKTKAKEIENIMHYNLLFEIISHIEETEIENRNILKEKLVQMYISQLDGIQDKTKNKLYSSEKIGEYIENLSSITGIQIKQKYKNETGTLYSQKKMKFAELASELIKDMTYDDCMSKEVKELTEKLVGFIKENNK